MKTDIESIILEARAEAQLAAERTIPTPVTMAGYLIKEGCCGFAWVTVLGRGNFTKYIKENLNAHKNYGGRGYNIWYSNLYETNGSQSYERHMAAAEAYAEVLRKHGYTAFASGRLD